MATELEFDTDDNDELGYCDSATCEAEAEEEVAVSEDKAHDGTRNYCSQCYEAYMVGVQHGRYHEAARHGDKPGRDCSQQKPMVKQ